MRRTSLSAAVCLAALAGAGLAQVLSPPEIQDLDMRALQEKHLTELKTVGLAISEHRFPYRLYFSRALDLNEQQQQRKDQRAIRFDKFRNQTVLEIGDHALLMVHDFLDLESIGQKRIEPDLPRFERRRHLLCDFSQPVEA